MPIEKISGLIAATFTPLTAEGKLDLNPIPAMADMLVREGASGVFVCGSTGESLSLTVEERMEVVEAWASVLKGRLKLLVHVGHTCVPDSVRLAEHAASIEADGISAMSPVFFKPADIPTLVSVCEEIADAAPLTPFYYYHIPSMTGVSFPMLPFLEAASERIANLAGIKYTHENLMEYRQLVEFDGGRFDILFGRDEILLSALIMGATGAIGSTYNHFGSLFTRVIKAFNDGDLATARELQTRAIHLIDWLIKAGGLPAFKAAMKFKGVDCGPVRLPLRNLEACQLEALAHGWEERQSLLA